MVSDGKLRISAPFNAPIYRFANGLHPLLMQLIENSDFAEFVPARTEDPTFSEYIGALHDAEAYGEDIIAQPEARDRIGTNKALEYLLWRDLTSQAMMERNVDLAFHHTTPLTLGNLPWILHIENVTTLFWPFLNHGLNRNVTLRQQPVYWIIRHVLERDDFKGLFTHMRQTASVIHTMFQSDIISKKVHYAPLGAKIEEKYKRLISRGMLDKHSTNRRVEILFTNSWHQLPENFFNRGGLDAVTAFLRLLESYENAHLTILSSLPTESLDPQIASEIRSHPKMTLLSEKIPDDRLFELLVSADIFILPSAALHSLSVLRAMQSGAVCIVSDAPGFAEFIEHDKTGFIVPGRCEQVVSKDHETGWLQDDYKSLKSVSPKIVDGLASTLIKLCRNPEYRAGIARAATKACSDRFPFDGFRNAFEQLVTGVVDNRGDEARKPIRQFGKLLARGVSDDVRFFPTARGTDYAELIEEGNEYNFVRSGSRFTAINKSLGQTFLHRERLGERELGDLLLQDESLETLQARVREIEKKRAAAAPPVATLLKDLGRYNLVRAGGVYLAISKELGPTSLFVEKVGDRELGDLVLKDTDPGRLEARVREFEAKRAALPEDVPPNR